VAAENSDMDAPLARRRQLRRSSTDAEASLWCHLRSRRLAGFKFRRQHLCGPFILDFFCAERNLAIELDGGQHFEPATQHRDARRTRYLVQCGIAVMRFPTDLVFRNLDSVLTAIFAALSGDRPSP
jgi:very-short-patch-repair endonuclease